MASSGSGASLSALYRNAGATLKKFDDGEITMRDGDFAQSLHNLIAQLKECLSLIEAHGLFSPNEEVEDVPTAHLKYAHAPFRQLFRFWRTQYELSLR